MKWSETHCEKFINFNSDFTFFVHHCQVAVTKPKIEHNIDEYANQEYLFILCSDVSH